MSSDRKLYVNYFRGEVIPLTVKVSNKMHLIQYALLRYRYERPITNGEFVYDLRCARFGGYLHQLREQGWVISTVRGKEKGLYLYYLVSHPRDEDNNQDKLQLIHGGKDE